MSFAYPVDIKFRERLTEIHRLKNKGAQFLDLFGWMKNNI
jgi:hypothetical protein